MSPLTLNIIGAGRLGKTLAYLFHQHQCFQLQAIHNRSLASTQNAVDFIQAGTTFTQITDMPMADIWLLSCSDDQLKTTCEQLINSRTWQGHEIIFHCSGSLSSNDVLQVVKQQNLAIASIHPIKSFADPQTAIHSFAGTFCGVEGDKAALTILQPAFEQLGAHCFNIKASEKTLYHAASVIACNYLVALQELSIQTYEQAGVSREQALQILNPIVQNTAQNIFQMGTKEALTGPIARGDQQTVEKQLSALKEWQSDYGELYRLLGKLTTQIAPDSADQEGLRGISHLLR